MSNEKLKPIHITNRTALKLVNEFAPKQNRSLANCAAAAIIEALGKKRNPGQPAFLDNVIVKGQENLSSEKPQ